MQSLTEYLDGSRDGMVEQDMVDDTTTPRPRFAVTNLDTAAWAVRKIAEARAEGAQIDAYAEAEIERINRWRAEATKPLECKIDYLTGLLAVYHQELLQADPKAKTVKLPHGELRMRAQQPEWNYDEDALLSWLQTNATHYVRTVETPDKAALKKSLLVVDGGSVALSATGEVVPGITVTTRPAKFSVATDSHAG